MGGSRCVGMKVIGMKVVGVLEGRVIGRCGR